MSREISLVNDYDGVFKNRVEARELRVEVPPAALTGDWATCVRMGASSC